MQSSTDVLPWSTSYYTVHKIKNYSEQYWFSLSSHPRQTNGGKLSGLHYFNNLHDTKKAKQSILPRWKLVGKNQQPHTSFHKWTTLIYTKAVQLFQLIEHKNYSEQNWLALSSHQKKKKLTNSHTGHNSTFQAAVFNNLHDTKKDKMKNPIKLKISFKKANTNIHHSGGWLMHSPLHSTSVGPCEELSFHSQT